MEGPTRGRDDERPGDKRGGGERPESEPEPPHHGREHEEDRNEEDHVRLGRVGDTQERTRGEPTTLQSAGDSTKGQAHRDEVLGVKPLD